MANSTGKAARKRYGNRFAAKQRRDAGDTDLEAYFLYLADAGPKPAWCVR